MIFPAANAGPAGNRQVIENLIAQVKSHFKKVVDVDAELQVFQELDRVPGTLSLLRCTMISDLWFILRQMRRS